MTETQSFSEFVRDRTEVCIKCLSHHGRFSPCRNEYIPQTTKAPTLDELEHDYAKFLEIWNALTGLYEKVTT